MNVIRWINVWLLASTFCIEVVAEDWPHWRGSSRNGITFETSGWDGNDWIASKPDWSAQVGEGASSPLVIGDQVFALGHQEGKNLVSCLEASSGKLLWSSNYATPMYGRNATGDEGIYSGPSSTPEYDPRTRFLYTLSSDGDLHCWDTSRKGSVVWQKNLYDEYSMPQRAKVGRSGRRDYGYTSAPLLHEQWLIVEVGGPNGTIVAFDKPTGKEAWRSQATSVAGHTGGMAPLAVEGVPCLASLTFDGLLVVRLDEPHAGETVATFPWITDFANNIASPAVLGDGVLITSSYNQNAICKLQIRLDGATELWRQPVASKACTPVIHKGHIYIAWNRLRVLDWETGQQVFEGPHVGDAGSCIVTADEKLIVWANKGDLFLNEIATKETRSCRELARVGRLARSDVWPHVVLANGQIFCRDREGKLSRFGLKAKL